MDYKKVIFPAFIILVLLQLFVPASMIFQQENVISSGKTFKFKTAPVDPYDPFRGKYVSLRFRNNDVEVAHVEDWKRHEKVYVSVSENEKGFAIIKSVSKEIPNDGSDYLTAKIRRLSESRIYVDYPFDRFYMEESKALEAETIYRESRRDTSQVAYALVKIKDGNAVLENVMINDVPLKEVVEKSRAEAE